MGSSGGGGGGTPANTTNVQTIREAPEIEARRLGLIDSAGTLASSPLNLPAFQVAGLSAAERQGITQAQQTGVGTSAITGAQTAAQQYGAGALQAASMTPSSTQFQDYLNPYQSFIIDEINRQSQLKQNQVSAQAVASGAFGGGREGVQLAEQERARLAQVGQAQESAFRGALGAFQQGQALQAQTGLGAGQLQAQTNLGAAQALQAGQQQDVAGLFGAGALERGIDQATLEAARQTQVQNITDPYQRLSFVSDIQRGAPSTQQTVAQGFAPQASPFAQAVGTGIGAYAALAPNK
jgi:hypothetical protein